MSRLTTLASVTALCLSLAACSEKKSTAATQPATAPATATKPGKDPAKARELIAAGAIVIDVRTPDEFSGGRLPQASNIPLQDFAQRIGEIDKLTTGDKTRPIVVYCASGNRSSKAKAQLEAAGYTQVINGGGYDDLM